MSWKIAPSKWTAKTLAGIVLLLLSQTTLLLANDIIVCKVSDSSSPVSGMFDFTIDGMAFSLVADGDCREFHGIGEGPHTVVEAGQTGVVLTEITVSPADRLVSFDTVTRTVTANAVDTSSVPTTITFKNKKQTGNQGCTPGFWKQDFHFGFWTGYKPTDLVGSVFTGALPSLSAQTLLEALQGGGGPGLLGKETILLRAAVAALLNASSGSVSYPYTTAQVISMVNAALATGDLTTITNLATLLDNANNGVGGCPLGGQNP